MKEWTNTSKNPNGRRAYIAWDDNDMHSSNGAENEKTKLCLVANQEENEVKSCESKPNLNYVELFTISEELNVSKSNLEKNVSNFKKTIFTIESKVDILNKET